MNNRELTVYSRTLLTSQLAAAGRVLGKLLSDQLTVSTQPLTNIFSLVTGYLPPRPSYSTQLHFGFMSFTDTREPTIII